MARLKKDNQSFHFDFKLLGWGPASSHWLRTLRQNFARLVSLTAFQHVSKHAIATLTQSCPQWYKVATKENRKNGNFALIVFYFWSRF